MIEPGADLSAHMLRPFSVHGQDVKRPGEGRDVHHAMSDRSLGLQL